MLSLELSRRHHMCVRTCGTVGWSALWGGIPGKLGHLRDEHAYASW